MSLCDDIRKHFPLLRTENPLIYFDNAGTTLTPESVIKKIEEVYREYPANIHRSAHQLGSRASMEFEKSRAKVQQFIRAPSPENIIFTSGATEALNTLCKGIEIKEGDEVIVTEMEHHSNFAPWKIQCDLTGAKLKVVPLLENGQLDIKQMERMVTKRTKMVCTTYVSNTLGTVNPIAEIRRISQKVEALLTVDASQAVAHFPIDVQKLDVDFLCFSGHKMFGPFGIGVLYGKENQLKTLKPYKWGGGMVAKVSSHTVSSAVLPYRLEAGTPAIASAIALGTAVDFIESIGFEAIMSKEKRLADYLENSLSQLPFLSRLGSSSPIPIYTFIMDTLHPHDLNTFLDQMGIAIRAGHHCTQPIMDRYGVLAANRISLSLFNTFAEIDALKAALTHIQEMVT